MFIFQVKKINNNQNCVSFTIDIRDQAGLFHAEVYSEDQLLFEDGLCIRDAEPMIDDSFTIFKNELFPNGVDDIEYDYENRDLPGSQLSDQLEKFKSIMFQKITFKAVLSIKDKQAFLVEGWELIQAQTKIKR